MNQFDDRQRGEEKRFQIEQELEFKAQARRAKLVGRWVAGLMGLNGDAAEDYAKSVVMPTWSSPASRICSGKSAPISTCTPCNSPITRSAPRWTSASSRRASRSRRGTKRAVGNRQLAVGNCVNAAATAYCRLPTAS